MLPILEIYRMKDEDKTKNQLIDELVKTRQRITELEALKARRKQVEQALLKSEEKFRGLAELMAPVF